MRGRRRRGDNTQISFFSFQDIITALAGIMIFIALMLVLEATSTALSAPTAASPTTEPRGPVMTAAGAAAEIQHLQRRVDAMRAEARDLSAQANALAVADPSTTRRQIQDLQKELDQLKAERSVTSSTRTEKEATLAKLVADRDRQIAELRAMAAAKAKVDAAARRVVFTLPGDQDQRKDVVLMEVSGADVRLGLLSDGREFARVTDASSDARLTAVVAALRGRQPDRHDVLVLFKPSGFSDPVGWIRVIRELGYRVGWEPLEEDRRALDSARN